MSPAARLAHLEGLIEHHTVQIERLERKRQKILREIKEAKKCKK